MSQSETRGERNNNPGNIRISSTQWLGKIPGHDAAFETFSSVEYGIRALAKILITYQEKHGLKTIRQIINRWAPPSENDTNSYVNSVARDVGVGADDEVRVPDVLLPLTKAIIKHENGRVVYSDIQIIDGLRKLIPETQPPAPVEDRSTKAKEKDMAPFLLAAIPSLISAIPEFARIFASPNVAERNIAALVKASEMVMTAVDAPNIQAAVEKIQSDPQAAEAANTSLRASRAELMDIMEREDAIKQKSLAAARDFSKMERPVIGQFKFIHLLSILFVLFSGIGSIVVLNSDKFSQELKGAIVTLILIGGWTGVKEFWLGSSNSSQMKDELRKPD
jgi:hypothetical protein